MVKTNLGKKYSCHAKFENNQGNDVTFVGEELFHTNKDVSFSKQFYTNMTFTLTTFYPLKVQVVTSILRFPLIVPVIANAALYWIVSSLFDKRELLC